MNCFSHPETPAAAFCRTCGKALCETCRRTAQGTVFCEEHLPAQNPAPATASPAAGPLTGQEASPGLAFLLGMIPGVGAIYNGQYAKGLVHVVIFGLLISIVSSGAAGGLEPLFGILLGVSVFYMAFEAFHTASKRQRGEPVEEFSSLVPLQSRTSGFPAGPVFLIVLGVVFLLNTMNFVPIYEILRYWPLFLIALGVYMLYSRLSGDRDRAARNQEAPNERQ